MKSFNKVNTVLELTGRDVLELCPLTASEQERFLFLDRLCQGGPHNCFNSYSRQQHIRFGVELILKMSTSKIFPFQKVLHRWVTHDNYHCCFSHVNDQSESEKAVAYINHKYHLCKDQEISLVDGIKTSENGRRIGIDHVVYIVMDWFCHTGIWEVPKLYAIEDNELYVHPDHFDSLVYRYEKLSVLYDTVAHYDLRTKIEKMSTIDQLTLDDFQAIEKYGIKFVNNFHHRGNRRVRIFTNWK